MSCDFCGAATPPGAPYCTFCGKPMALNAAGQERPPGAGNFPGPVPQTPPSQYTTAYPFSSAPATGSHQPVAVPHQGPYNAPQYPAQVPIDQRTTLPQFPMQQGGQPSQQLKPVQPSGQFPPPYTQPFQLPIRQPPTAFSGRTLIKPPFVTDALPPVNAGQTELYSGSPSQIEQQYRSPGTQDLPPISPDQMQPAGGYFPSTQFSPSQNTFMVSPGSPDTGSLQPPFGNNPFAPPDMPGTYAPVEIASDDDDSSDGRYKAWLQPRRRKKTLLIGAGALLAVVLIGIIVIMLLPLANPSKTGSKNVGGSSAIPTTAGNANATTTPEQKGTATNSKGIPSSSSVNKDASAVISEVKTANKIDEKTLQPTKTTDKFKPKEMVYVTFKLDSKGKDGYILAQWYGNGHEVGSKIYKHKSGSNRGLFGLDYHDPATGAVALYWCNKEKCEDKQLAAVTTFTVVADKPGNGTPTTQGSQVTFSRRII